MQSDYTDSWASINNMSQCPIHNVPMKQMWKKSDPDHTGDSWFSHKEGDSWCNGKPPKASSNAVQSQALDAILNKIIKLEAGQLEIKQLLASIGAREAVKPSPSDTKLPF